MDKENNVISGDVSDYKEMIPAMNVSVPAQKVEDDNLITDDALLGVYTDIFGKVKSDREEVDSYIAKFADMIFNDGDATTSTKEAFVNLVKLKTDASDKMTKLADLMTRVKLKEKDTFPRYLAASQNNTIHIGDNGAKRALLKEINKAQKKKEKSDE
jgi:hypothetical protein